MDINALDQESRDMLTYLNTNSNLTNTTLAEAFNQHYRANLGDAIQTLQYLQNNNLVNTKLITDKSVLMIQVTHKGRTYEQELFEHKKREQNKILVNLIWHIITLLLSGILTIAINLIMKWGFGI